MAKKQNNKKSTKNTKPKGEVKETVEEEVVETPEEETEEVETDEVETTDEDEVEEESEDEESDEEESEDEEEEVESEVETEDATGEVTRYGVYRGGNCVAEFNIVNHGKDFIKLATAKAKQLSTESVTYEARPFEDPAAVATEKTVVKIVNRSGNLVRQFAKSTHGDDYAKLADAFIKKHGEKKGLSIQK